MTYRTKNRLKGKRFGRLVVIGFHRLNSRGAIMWHCRCDCGNHYVVSSSHLAQGGTKSCGCLRRQLRTTHGLSRTPFRDAWRNLLSRCYNKDDEDYQYYGARGIAACESIRATPRRLKELLGDKPTGMTVDRINNNLGYFCGCCAECFLNRWPMNLRWATRSQQNANRRYLGRKHKHK